jgi:anti-sigma regulatory factor (Ser/Thr protein kinase)
MTSFLFEERLPATRVAPFLARCSTGPIVAPVLSEQGLHDFQLIVSELVTNAFLHAGGEADDPIALTLDVQDDLVHVEVQNRGRVFEPSLPLASTDAEGGRGLMIVEALADRWGVGTDPPPRVWFELAIG